MIEFIQQAEALGLDEIWLGDEGPARDPLSVLAAAATRTRSIRLGVGITNPYVRHPAMTAVSMMTVHELSGGRAVLGLGVGGNLALGPLGITPVHPLATVRTALRTIRAVVRGERNDGYSPPATAMTAPDLPLYIGSRGPLINRLASRAADGAFVAGLPVSQLAEVVVTVQLAEHRIGQVLAVQPIAVAVVGCAAGLRFGLQYFVAKSDRLAMVALQFGLVAAAVLRRRGFPPGHDHNLPGCAGGAAG